MNLSLNNNLKLAIQKKGRLTDDTLKLLNTAGLIFDNYQQNLFSNCQNFPLEIIYLRDDDIPECVYSGVADLGIVGKNVLYEVGAPVDELLNLGFGFCSLCLAIPNKSKIKKISDLQNLTIATSYPSITQTFLKNEGVSAKIIKVNGSVEIFPTLGASNAIVDIVSTGNSLTANNLKILKKILDIQAVLIANKSLNFTKQKLLTQFIKRLNQKK